MIFTLQELACLCDAEVQGDSALEVSSAGDIMTAELGQVTVLSNIKYKVYLKDSQATACFIAQALKDNLKAEDIPEQIVFIVCKDPEISFLTAVSTLHPETKMTHSISAKSDIAENARLGHDVHVGAFTTIGENTCIGDDTELLSNVHVGNNVTIGKNCRMHPSVVIYDDTVIGDNVIIHSGTVLGADGFGYKFRNNVHVKVPHVGNIIVEENVEIGANTCIDRGALGSTFIGAGSKIDNLVQLGHHNRLGKNVIICGQSGISGSCHIDDGAILAGGASLADHVNIGKGAIVMARSGVSSDVPAHTQVFGVPAKPRKTAWKELAALSNLPALMKKFKVFESRLKKLEES